MSSQPQTYLQVRGVTKSFGRFIALENIDLTVERGEFVCFLGPSGCGKTTLLRIIAGLEVQDRGQIIQDGRDVSRLPASSRDFGIVFQSYALFPNLTAAENIAYGLHGKGMRRDAIQARVEELLALIGLSGSGGKYPAQLSGGQQQRIALARALAPSPTLLLLDEPLSALDARVRAGLRNEITQLQRRLGVTTIMVTHDQIEALTMADRIVVMDHGHIVQVGTPLQIYQRPATPFVADFVGAMNFLPAQAHAPHQVRCGSALLSLNGHTPPLTPGSPLRLSIRPEDVHPQPWQEGMQLPHNSVVGDLEDVEFLGATYRLYLRLRDLPDGAPTAPFLVDLSASAARGLALDGLRELTGKPWALHLPPDLLHAYPDAVGVPARRSA